MPQLLRSVPVRERRPLEQMPGLARALERAERELGDSGRVLIRYSGTEPVARVMVEGEDETKVAELCAALCDALRASVGEEGA